MNIMICTMMRGLDDDEIRYNISLAETYITENIEDILNAKPTNINFTNNHTNYKCPMFDNDDDGYRMFCLGSGIANVMSASDIIVLTPGWVHSKGCVAEALIAKLYNKRIIMLNRDFSGKLYVASHDDFITNLNQAMVAMGIKKEV